MGALVVALLRVSMVRDSVSANWSVTLSVSSDAPPPSRRSSRPWPSPRGSRSSTPDHGRAGEDLAAGLPDAQYDQVPAAGRAGHAMEGPARQHDLPGQQEHPDDL